jgi:hypothetical protein
MIRCRYISVIQYIKGSSLQLNICAQYSLEDRVKQRPQNFIRYGVGLSGMLKYEKLLVRKFICKLNSKQKSHRFIATSM